MRSSDYIRLLFLAAIWGASFLFMRISVPEFGAINVAFLRVVFGFSGLAVLLIFFKSSFKFEGKFKATLILGIINSGLPFLMYSFAAKWLPAGYSAILNATTPLMGAIFGFTFFSEKLTWKKWIGVFLGLSGIMVITTVGESNTAEGTAFGIAACLIATSCYAIAGFLTRRWISNKGGLDAKLVAFGSQIGAVLFLLPFFIWSITTTPHVHWMQANVWASVIMLGLVCTAFAYIIYFKLIADIGPLRSLTVTFMIPPFGILWGYLVLGETITKGFILGAIIICIAVWMVVSSDKKMVSQPK